MAMGDGKETARLVRLRVAEIRAQKKRRRRRLGAAALGVCLFVAALSIAAMLWRSSPGGIELEDAPMPMGSMEEDTPLAPEILLD